MDFRYGNYPTMITPYKTDGSVDYEMVEKYVDWYADNGCDGIFAVCQSSEIFYLTLEEKVKINSIVYKKAKEIEKKTGKPFTIVSSGHTSDSIEGQIEELNAIVKSGTDALIFITNRFAKEDESDEVWIKNAETVLKSLPKEVCLGLYECPYPYKRLVTEKVLNWCKSTGRFYFMKDTCCNAREIEKRLKILEGSSFALLNANCQTLLASIRAGGKGYCGIMSNFHPRLYGWLCQNPYHEKAELVQAVLGSLGFTESGLPYPLSAKYSMTLCGNATENYARNRRAEELTDYGRDCIKQMKLLTDTLEKELGL